MKDRAILTNNFCIYFGLIGFGAAETPEAIPGLATRRRLLNVNSKRYI